MSKNVFEFIGGSHDGEKLEMPGKSWTFSKNTARRNSKAGKGDRKMIEKGLYSRIVTAAVLASGLWLGLAAGAEEKKTAPVGKGGKVVGILLSKTATEITVKPDGKQESETYLLAPPGGALSPGVDAAVKKLFIPNLVAIKWQRQGEDAVVTGISALLSPPRRSVQVSGGKTMINYSLTGTLQGTVVDREVNEKACHIDVKPAGKQDFIACEGPASLVQKAFKKGVLDLTGFEILKQDFTECYWPPFVIDKATNKGGVDPKVIETMRTLNPGDRVKIEWYYDERKRAAKLDVLSRAPAPKPTEKEKE